MIAATASGIGLDPERGDHQASDLCAGVLLLAGDQAPVADGEGLEQAA